MNSQPTQEQTNKIKELLRTKTVFIANEDELGHFKVLLDKNGENPLMGWDDTYKDEEPVISGYVTYSRKHRRYIISKNTTVQHITFKTLLNSVSHLNERAT